MRTAYPYGVSRPSEYQSVSKVSSASLPSRSTPSSCTPSGLQAK